MATTPWQHAIFSRLTGEFISVSQEKAFLQKTWHDFKAVPAVTLIVLGVMTAVFAVTSFLTPSTNDAGIFLIRICFAVFLTAGGTYIYRADAFFEKYFVLLLTNQILIALIIFFLAASNQITWRDLLVSTIGLTLIYYQFFFNRFLFSVAGCLFLGLGSVIIGLIYFDTVALDILNTLILIISVNIMGIFALRSINQTKRSEYMALVEVKQANHEKENLIRQLQTALAEVKTLESFLPICANCHSIRNDEGFWERVEKYIQDRTGTRFSHSICPECLKKLYPTIYGDKD